MAIPWWIHPVLAAGVVSLTAMTVYVGRMSAKAPTESYQPIARLHIILAVATISLACVAVLLGPYLMDEAGLDAWETPHAFVGLAAVSLWLVQGCLGWLLWNDKEKVRRFHRYNGFIVLGLALLQAPLGLAIALEFMKYY